MKQPQVLAHELYAYQYNAFHGMKPSFTPNLLHYICISFPKAAYSLTVKREVSLVLQ